MGLSPQACVPLLLATSLLQSSRCQAPTAGPALPRLALSSLTCKSER